MLIFTVSFSAINNQYMEDELDQKQENYCGWAKGCINNGRFAQSFRPTMPLLTRIQLYCYQKTNFYDGLRISIRSSLNGPDLTSIYTDEISSRLKWVEFDIDDIEVYPDHKYYIIWEQVGGYDTAAVYWGYGGGNSYSLGSAWFYNGDTWGQVDSDYCPNPIDFCFQTYGSSTTNPIADFNFSPNNPSIGEDITFDASDSYDLNGEIVSYEWNFGDGQTGTGKTISHIYDVFDEYMVHLSVMDDEGKTDSISKTVTMKDNISPSVQIISPEKDNLYISGIKIPFFTTVIIGDIDIIIEASDDESGIDFVKLNIGSDNKILWSEPFSHSWTGGAFGKITLEVIAYDEDANQAVDSIDVWKIF